MAISDVVNVMSGSEFIVEGGSDVREECFSVKTLRGVLLAEREQGDTKFRIGLLYFIKSHSGDVVIT